MRRTTLSQRRWMVLGILALASGAALLVHVFMHISLVLALLVTVIVVTIIGVLIWRGLPATTHIEMKKRALVGLLTGLLATGVYDLFRWVVVTVFHYTFWPFDIFFVFGRAMAGDSLPRGTEIFLGVIYHYINGIFFAIAYAILLAPSGWWTGILWALGLEALMLSIYPGWLHIQAFDEFLSVSMLGHVAYGLVLGNVSRWLLFRLKQR